MLYQTVAEHWPAFLERAEEHGGLPRFVVKEFEEYLRCGRLEHGCLHLVCRECGYSELVAFSCKQRGFCPSCLGRRMADTAVHLEQSVLPRVPIRHWICSLPWGLRALLGYDRKLCAEVVSAFMAEVDRSLRWRAKRQLGLASVADAHTGGVAAVQRTDSALRLNVHLRRPGADEERARRSGAIHEPGDGPAQRARHAGRALSFHLRRPHPCAALPLRRSSRRAHARQSARRAGEDLARQEAAGRVHAGRSRSCPGRPEDQRRDDRRCASNSTQR
ncbi:MAG: transposase zinc-binding domain-containing protein [Polyangiaceae bacterium]|nr:transposase zinc-binding domain-containing protein [Polyangiaceae bacterium]